VSCRGQASSSIVKYRCTGRPGSAPTSPAPDAPFITGPCAAARSRSEFAVMPGTGTTMKMTKAMGFPRFRRRQNQS
jgi:hypothetical protein